jgi:hypothetical protein
MYSDRLLCEVKVQDNIKFVTIRSTYKIENQTLYPLELTLIDDTGHPVYSLEKIGTKHDLLVFLSLTLLAVPGQCYSLPIEAVKQHRIRLQPDRTHILCTLFEQSNSDSTIRGLRIQMVFCHSFRRSSCQEKFYHQMSSRRS